MSTNSSKIVEEITKQLHKIEGQLQEFETLREERTRLKKLLVLMSTDKKKKAEKRSNQGLTKMVYESLQSGKELRCSQILTYLTEERGVEPTVTLANVVRGCLHSLKTARKIYSPGHGIWKVIPEESKTPPLNDGPPSINEILNPPKLVAGMR